MKDFPLKLARRNRSNQRRFATSFASLVDVKRYDYALIYCIVALSMYELLGIQRGFPPSAAPSLSLNFASFIYLNVHYNCVWSFDAFSFRVSLFVCGCVKMIPG